MTDFWLISYLGLWVIVIILGLLQIGILQQLGLLQRQLGQPGAERSPEPLPPPPERDGPNLGSSLPDLNVESVNGFGSLSTQGNASTLFMFMSTMCASCQMMVDPINLLIASELYRGRVVVILRADDHACQAFLKVFPLHVPVVQDRDGLITQGFEVHHNPFGLLYDTKGILIGKGVIARNEELLALVGEKVESSKESSPR